MSSRDKAWRCWSRLCSPYVRDRIDVTSINESWSRGNVSFAQFLSGQLPVLRLLLIIRLAFVAAESRDDWIFNQETVSLLSQSSL